MTILPPMEQKSRQSSIGTLKTGNHYLEFAQTSDGGATWVPSGFSISADEADLWVVVNEEWMRTHVAASSG